MPTHLPFCFEGHKHLYVQIDAMNKTQKQYTYQSHLTFAAISPFFSLLKRGQILFDEMRSAIKLGLTLLLNRIKSFVNSDSLISANATK